MRGRACGGPTWSTRCVDGWFRWMCGWMANQSPPVSCSQNQCALRSFTSPSTPMPSTPQDYDSALRLAVGPAQRDTIYLTMAQESFSQGNYKAGVCACWACWACCVLCNRVLLRGKGLLLPCLVVCGFASHFATTCKLHTTCKVLTPCIPLTNPQPQPQPLHPNPNPQPQPPPSTRALWGAAPPLRTSRCSWWRLGTRLHWPSSFPPSCRCAGVGLGRLGDRCRGLGSRLHGLSDPHPQTTFPQPTTPNTPTPPPLNPHPSTSHPPPQVLGRNDKAQSTLVASWLTELLLDSINRAALEGGGRGSGDPKYGAAVEQLRWGVCLRFMLGCGSWSAAGGLGG